MHHLSYFKIELSDWLYVKNYHVLLSEVIIYCTADSKIIRALDINRVKKFLLNVVL